MEQTIADFKNYLVSWRKSPRTVETYIWHLKKINEWGKAQHPPLTQAAAYKTRDLQRYLAERQLMDGIGASTLNVTISALKVFFAWVLGKKRSPAARLHYPREELREQRTLTPEQAAKVLEAPDTSSLIGRRDLAMLCLLLDTGLRASEVCALTLDGVHISDLYLTVRGKRGKLLVKAFCEYTAVQLSNYLAERKAVDGCDRFFVSVLHGSGHTAPPGKPLTRQALRGVCQRTAKAVGLGALSPHDFRRTCSYIAVLRGCPDRLVELQLGWGESARDMLSRYTLVLRVRNFLQYSPVAWLMSKAFTLHSAPGDPDAGELNP